MPITSRKYKRSGHLFQARFLVEKESDPLTVMGYVLNPVRAHTVPRPEDYQL